MADFGDFDQVEVDPAAEFLAREQNDLAGLEDDLKPAVISGTPALASTNNLLNGGGGGDASITSATFEMIDGLDGMDAMGEPGKERHSSDGFSFDSVHDTDDREGVSPTPLSEKREEPEKIKKWRSEQIHRLEEKDREEEIKKLEWQKTAKKELEDWYKNHEDIIAKTKAANRDAAKNAEKQFVADDNDIEPGTEWERIAKLCDFNPKAKLGNKDVSRMRSIILQRKQNQSSTAKA